MKAVERPRERELAAVERRKNVREAEQKRIEADERLQEESNSKNNENKMEDKLKKINDKLMKQFSNIGNINKTNSKCTMRYQQDNTFCSIRLLTKQYL